MASSRQYGVLGPLLSGAETRAFMGIEVLDGEPKADRPVVVVWLPDDVTSDPTRVARLQRETAFVTQLKHPNIIRVFGLECFEEGWARVVAFVDGEPLHQVLLKAAEATRSIDPRIAARITVDICEGVHYAHEEGQSRYAGRPIVHGGVRPDTLLVTFLGVTMVTGYGASVMAPTEHGVPIRSKFVYFAPEQIIGGKATASPATDVYAIGAVLHELLAGRPPYADAEDPERAVLTGEPPVIDGDGLLGRLGAIATTALAKRGAERFENVEVMKNAVLAAVAEEKVSLPSHGEVAKLVNELIPYNSPEREGRRQLLGSASDPDMITVLSRPAVAPEGVDAALFEASRPGPVSTMQTSALSPLESHAAIRSSPAREEKTVVELPKFPSPLDQPAGIPFHEAIEEKTIADKVPGLEALQRSDAVPSPPIPSMPPPAPMSQAQPSMQMRPQVPMQPQVSVHPQMQPMPAQPQMQPMPAQPQMQPMPAQPQMQPMPAQPQMQPMPVQAASPGSQRPVVHMRVPQGSLQPYVHNPGAPAANGQPGYFLPQQPTVHQPVPSRAPQPSVRPPPSAQELAQAALLQNQPVKNVPMPAPQPIPRAPMREESAITNFNAKTGDSSRIILFMILAAAAAFLFFVFAIGKEPPKGLDAPSEGTRLPQEMVQEMLTKAKTPSAEDVDTEAPPPLPVEPPVEGTPDEQATPPPAAPAFGQLAIDSDPSVDVYDGDQHLGRTPISVRLSTGNHKLRFTDQKTGINKYRTYRIDPGQDRKSSVEFGKSSLVVQAPDGAQISLNSRVIGKAPMDPVEIYEGRYLLRVTLDGMKWSEWFEAPPGQKIEYKVRLGDQ